MTIRHLSWGDAPLRTACGRELTAGIRTVIDRDFDALPLAPRVKVCVNCARTKEARSNVAGAWAIEGWSYDKAKE